MRRFDSFTFRMELEYKGYEDNGTLHPYGETSVFVVPKQTLIIDVFGPGTFYFTAEDMSFSFEGFDD